MIIVCSGKRFLTSARIFLPLRCINAAYGDENSKFSYIISNVATWRIYVLTQDTRYIDLDETSTCMHFGTSSYVPGPFWVLSCPPPTTKDGGRY